MKDKIWHTANYRWSGMIERCCKESHKDFQWYGGRGITVCESWRTFSNYERWFRENYYDVDGGVCVDKDLLGGTEYAPETCLLIPARLNYALPKKKRDEAHTTGVERRNKRYEVKVRDPLLGSVNQYIGMYDTLEEALSVYADCKNVIFQKLVTHYEGKIPTTVFKHLREYVFKH